MRSVPAVLSMTRSSHGVAGSSTSPSTVSREKAFQRSYAWSVSLFSFAHTISNTGEPLAYRWALIPAKPARTRVAIAAVVTRRALPWAAENAIAPAAAKAPISTTRLGPARKEKSTTSRTQPRPAPTRSTAYSRLTRRGKRVNARHTTMPLNTNGTEITRQVAATEATPGIVARGVNGIASWIAKQTTTVTPNSRAKIHS